MSASIEKISVYDPRLIQKNATNYAVNKGASSITTNSFQATSTTASQITFTIQAPSVNVYMDKLVQLQYKEYIQFQVHLVNNGGFATGSVTAIDGASYGNGWATCAFPLQVGAVASAQVTINDNQVSLTQQELLPQILRLVDSQGALKARGCPTALDKYLDNSVASGTLSDPTASYSNAVAEYVPNGAFGGVIMTTPNNLPLNEYSTASKNSADATTPFNTDGSLKAGAYLVQTDVAIALNQNGVPALFNASGNAVAGDGSISGTFYATIQASEPFCLSPFLYNEPLQTSEVGMFGLQTIQVVLNLGADVSRTIRSNRSSGVSGQGTTYSVAQNSTCAYNIQFNTNGAFDVNSTKVVCSFLTPPLGLSIPSKSIVPYFDIVKNTTQTTAPAGAIGQVLQSNTFTLNSIPDLIAIYIRPVKYQTANQGDWTCPISNIVMNFNNVNGLLSSVPQFELWNMSYKNGLRNMNWQEWSGKANVVNGNSVGIQKLVGSIVLLRPVTDFALGSLSLSNGSTGQFNAQFSVTFDNPSPNAESLMCYMISYNSGFFESQTGVSTVLKSVLSESDVISAPNLADGIVTAGELEREVGAGAFRKMSNSMLKHRKHHKMHYAPIMGGAPSGGVKHSSKKHSSRLF